MAKKRLGDLLLELKAKTPGAMPTLAPESIEQALATQKLGGGRLGEILLKMRVITEEDLLQVLGPAARDPLQPGPEGRRRRLDLATSIPIGFAKQHRLLVVKREGDSAMVATADPLEIGAFDDLRMQLSLEVQPFLVPSQRILEVINDVYGRRADKGGDLGKDEDEEDDGRQRGAGRHPRDHRRGPDHPLGQLAAVQRRQGAGERYPHRAGREGGHGPLPHRRRAVRVAARGAPVHAVDHLAREDHGGAQHRREAAAPGRPHPPQDRRQGHRHARRDRPDGQAGRAHHHPSARPRIGAARSCRHRLR